MRRVEATCNAFRVTIRPKVAIPSFTIGDKVEETEAAAFGNAGEKGGGAVAIWLSPDESSIINS